MAGSRTLTIPTIMTSHVRMHFLLHLMTNLMKARARDPKVQETQLDANNSTSLTRI